MSPQPFDFGGPPSGRNTRPALRLLLPLLLVAPLLLALRPGMCSADEPPPYEQFTLRGRMVWLAEAMTRLHGVKLVPEAAQQVLCLEAVDGRLHPLLEDVRGRAFRVDQRLRQLDVELFVRRHRGSPMIQVVRAFEIRGPSKFTLDYWCDICAIVMFELKPCDCCQGPIQLRKRLVDRPESSPESHDESREG